MPEELVFFEDFVLSRSACELRRGGTVVPLQRIPFEVLGLLVERQGQVVTRQEILERVWGKGVFVDIENAINTALRKIRRALGDHPEEPRFVLTVPARGYRFVAQIRRPKTGNTGHFRARGLDTMVGRERELTSLMTGLSETLAGRGRMVFLVSGEPGIGKTRLADEFAAVAETKGLAVRIGHCIQEAVPFLPFVEMLERFVDGLGEPEQLRQQLAEEASELTRLLPKLKRILHDLPPALDLPPAQARRHLFNCFCDFVARIATEQPTLMIVEDLHWADDSTLALLDHLAQRIANLPLMLLCCYRDAEIDLTRGLAKTLEDLLRGRIATRLKLKGLPRDDVVTMLNRLSGKSAPPEVVEEIFAETDGNPFFVEELFRHLDEENQLYNSAGEFHSSLNIAEFEVPESVRLVVGRRLERLVETTRKILATAATIGRFFSFELLEAASGTDRDSLIECIEGAERAGLVYSLTKAPKARFQFSHELVRQAVISRLSSALRQKLHLDVAEAIERIFSETLEDYISDLAHHYGRGGNRLKAIQYLRLAAQQCIQRSASGEAIDHLTNALGILKTLPGTEQRDRQELALQTMLGPALIATRGNSAPEVGAAYERAVEVGRRVGEDARLFPVLFGLRSFHLVRGELHTASRLAEQLVILAEGTQDSGFQIEAHLALGNSLFLFGDLTPALEHFERAMSLYKPQEHRAHAFVYGLDPGVFCLGRIGWVLEFQGYPDRGLQQAERALALAHEQLHPYSLAMAVMHLREIYIYRREWSAVQHQTEAGISIAVEQGFATVRAQATMGLGRALAEQGLTDRGIALIHEGLAAVRTAEAQLFQAGFLYWLARALLKGGRAEEGLAAITEANALMEKTGERFIESLICQTRGQLLLALNSSNAAEAEQLFHDAIRVSRRQGARLLELRATTSLAGLLRDTNRRDEARAMLGEIYNWFTEGFDLPDLKDAKALLEELNNSPR